MPSAASRAYLPSGTWIRMAHPAYHYLSIFDGVTGPRPVAGPHQTYRLTRPKNRPAAKRQRLHTPGLRPICPATSAKSTTSTTGLRRTSRHRQPDLRLRTAPQTPQQKAGAQPNSNGKPWIQRDPTPQQLPPPFWRFFDAPKCPRTGRSPTVSGVRWIVDGMNVIGCPSRRLVEGPPAAAVALVDNLERWGPDHDVTVVFEAPEKIPDPIGHHHRRARRQGQANSADDEIVRLVQKQRKIGRNLRRHIGLRPGYPVSVGPAPLSMPRLRYQTPRR